MKNIFFLMAIIFIAGSISAKLADSPWATYHSDSRHTGVSKYPTNIQTPSLKWKFYAGSGIESSPVIGMDGTIYFGAVKDHFFALFPNGTEKWRFIMMGEEFRSSASLGDDGTIYVSSLYDLRMVYNIMHERDMEYGVPKLYALNPDGTLKWQFIVGGIFAGTINTPLIGDDGTIYIGAGSNDMTKDAVNGYRFIALNKDGALKWSFKTIKEIYSSAAMADDGTIVFGCADGNVYALNQDGTEKWKFTQKEYYFDSTPAIGSDGTAYISSTNQYLYAISATGEEKWRYKMNDFLETNPSIGLDGTIYAGVIDFSTIDKHLYAFNPDGSVKWKYETGGGVYSTPAIDSNGIIFFGSYDQHAYSLHPNGTLRWKFKLGGPIVVSPTIDKEGTLYFGTWDKYLYAIDGKYRESEKVDGDPARSICGNNKCEGGEETSCKNDCYGDFICGDGICQNGEVNCHDDCDLKSSKAPEEKKVQMVNNSKPICGDNQCSEGEVTSCEIDCDSDTANKVQSGAIDIWFWVIGVAGLIIGILLYGKYSGEKKGR